MWRKDSHREPKQLGSVKALSKMLRLMLTSRRDGKTEAKVQGSIIIISLKGISN
jgi:hypothetical protein